MARKNKKKPNKNSHKGVLEELVHRVPFNYMDPKSFYLKEHIYRNRTRDIGEIDYLVYKNNNIYLYEVKSNYSTVNFRHAYNQLKRAYKKYIPIKFHGNYKYLFAYHVCGPQWNIKTKLIFYHKRGETLIDLVHGSQK